MITLRNFTPADAAVLAQHNVCHSADEAERLIEEWSHKSFDGKRFEMFAVAADQEIVGMISLWERSESIVSIGPEIFEPYRKQGYGKGALALCMNSAKEHGYKVVVQQIRENNTASRALHASLGFETDGNLLKNRHGNPVLIYVKTLG